jgi:tRNA-Thr(GGU) m(6)t(6)A37 methyltransferase TsaA
MRASYLFEPIGVVRSPFHERAAAPRQASAGRDVAGRVELHAGRGYEHALEGLSVWEYVWIVFVFHRNVEQGRGWKAKVLPPRSDTKQGVFATRSPHRPNPIGMSAVAVERVEGLAVHVRGLDLLDGTPVLDLKPYVAYADSHPEARAGWLEARDPAATWDVRFGSDASEELEWLRSRGVDLIAAIRSVLALGPRPHPYRRIREHAGGMRLAIKDWRVDFVVAGTCIDVRRVCTGYRAKDLLTEPGLDVHREFVARFGAPLTAG